MAKSPAEIQKAYRERQKALKQTSRPLPKPKPKPTPDAATSSPSRPFSAFLKERESNLMFPESLHWVGVELEADLMSDRPKIEMAPAWEEIGRDLNSLTLASSMVEIFIDAAKELAGLINEYKFEEIDRQIAGASPIKAAELEQLKKRLSKRTSHFFPVFDAKGD